MLRTLLFIFFSCFFLCSCDNFITKSPNFGDIPAGSVVSLVFSTLPSGASTGGFLFPPPSVQVGSSGSSSAHDMLFKFLGKGNADAASASVTLSLYSDAECTTPVLTAPDGITNSLLGTLAQQSSSGAAIFPDIIITKASSFLYLKAEASGFNSVCSSAIPVSSGGVSSTASTLTYSGVPIVGASLAVIYTALDEYGNSNPSGYSPAALTFGFSGSASGVFGSVTSLGNGVFTTIFTPSAAGVESITLSLTTTGGISSQISGINIINVDNALIFSGFPTTVTAGGTISVTVTAYTSIGGIDTGYAQPISLISSDPYPATISPSSSIVPTSGVATFSVTLYTITTGGTLEATGTGKISAVQGGITVSAGSVSSLGFAGFPASILPGSSFSFFIEALDPYNNLVPSYANSVTLLSSDPTATYLPANPTAITSGGMTSVTMTLSTLTTGGVLKATSGSLSGTQSGINVGVPNSLVFSSISPTMVTAGGTINVTVTAYSSTGGVDTSYTQPISLASSDAYPATITLLSTSGGVANFSVTLYTATTGGTLLATASGKISAVHGGITVNAGSASSLDFANFPTSIWGGISFSFLIEAKDLYNNQVPNYTSANPITIASSDPSAAYISANPTTITSGGMTSVTMILYAATTGGTLQATIAGGSLSKATLGGIFVGYLTSSSDINPLHKIFWGTALGLGGFDTDKTTGLISGGGLGNYTLLTGGTSAAPISFALTPDSQFLYLLMQNEKQVYIFDTNQATTGVPTSVGGVAISSVATVVNSPIPRFTTSVSLPLYNDYLYTPPLLSASADGQYLYVLNPTISAGGSWIDGFSITAGSGLLTSIGGIAVISPSGGAVIGTTIVTVSPGYVYVGAYDSTHSVNFVSSFSINSGTGGLFPVSTGVVVDSCAGVSIVSLSPALTPSGHTFLYAGESCQNTSGQFSTLSASSGVLSLLQQVSITAAWHKTYMVTMVVPPTGEFLYGTDGNYIYNYSIDSNTGLLSTTYITSAGGGAALIIPIVAMAVTADSKYLNILQEWGIGVYAISPSTGSLVQASWMPLPITPCAAQIANNNALDYSYIAIYEPNALRPLQRDVTDGSLNAHFNLPLQNQFSIAGEGETYGLSLTVTNANQYLYYMCYGIFFDPSLALSAIFQYEVDPTTADLTALTPAYVNTSGLSFSLITYNNQYLYVPYYLDATGIDQYSIGSNGGLTFVASNASGIPGNAALTSADTVKTPAGSFLYAVDYQNSAVYQYGINTSTGNLTLLSPSSGGFSTNSPTKILVAQDGQYAYLADSLNDRILLLSIDQTSGLLTSIGGVNVGMSVVNIFVTPNMEYLYALATDSNGNAVIYSYAIGAGMTLTAIGSPISTNEPQATLQGAAIALGAGTISADSAYFYVAFANGLIYQYAIGGGGLLTPLSPLSALADPSLVTMLWR